MSIRGYLSPPSHYVHQQQLKFRSSLQQHPTKSQTQTEISGLKNRLNDLVHQADSVLPPNRRQHNQSFIITNPMGHLQIDKMGPNLQRQQKSSNPTLNHQVNKFYKKPQTKEYKFVKQTPQSNKHIIEAKPIFFNNQQFYSFKQIRPLTKQSEEKQSSQFTEEVDKTVISNLSNPEGNKMRNKSVEGWHYKNKENNGRMKTCPGVPLLELREQDERIKGRVVNQDIINQNAPSRRYSEFSEQPPKSVERWNNKFFKKMVQASQNKMSKMQICQTIEQIIYPSSKQVKNSQLSWTKYLKMQFKNEELCEQIKRLQGQIQSLHEKQGNIILQHQQNIQQIKMQHKIEMDVQAYILKEQKMNHESIIQSKNEYIQKLIDRQVELAQQDRNLAVQLYIKDVLSENSKINEELNQIKLREESRQQSQARQAELEKSVEFAQNQNILLRNQIKVLSCQAKKIKELLALKSIPLEDVVKSQLNELNTIEERVECLQEENLRMKESICQLQRTITNKQAEFFSSQLVGKTQRNKLMAETSIALTSKDNKIQSLSRKIETMEQKYKSVLNDVKLKDEFLQKYLVGRTNEADVKEHILQILSKYEDNFEKYDKLEEYKAEIQKLLKKISLYHLT